MSMTSMKFDSSGFEGIRVCLKMNDAMCWPWPLRKPTTHRTTRATSRKLANRLLRYLNQEYREKFRPNRRAPRHFPCEFRHLTIAIADSRHWCFNFKLFGYAQYQERNRELDPAIRNQVDSSLSNMLAPTTKLPLGNTNDRDDTSCS